MAASGGALAPNAVNELVGQIEAAGLTLEQVADKPLLIIFARGLNERHQLAAKQKLAESAAGGGGGGSVFGTQPLGRPATAMGLPLGASGSAGYAALPPLGASGSAGSAARLPLGASGSADGRLSVIPGKRLRTTSALAASSSAGAANNTDFRDEFTQIIETNFITRLLANQQINIFVQTLIFRVIAKAKVVGFSQKKIRECLEVKYINTESNTYIQNIGLKPENAVVIVDLADFSTFSRYCNTNNITFMQLMGALFNFQINFELLALCIKASEAYKEKFMLGARKYLSLPPTLSFTEFTRQYLDEKNRTDVYYTIWYYFTTKIQNLFFINQHRALNNPKMDKAALIQSGSDKLFIIDPRLYKYNQLQDLLDLGGGLSATALAGNVFSAPGDNFWLDLQRDAGKEVISGPSGSACILFRFLFETIGVLAPTLPNMIMLLLAMSGHYSMLFHSLTEILQMYIECITTTLPGSLPEADHYNIAKNDVDYILNLVQKHLGDRGVLYAELTTGGISNSALNLVVQAKLGRSGSGGAGAGLGRSGSGSAGAGLGRSGSGGIGIELGISGSVDAGAHSASTKLGLIKPKPKAKAIAVAAAAPVAAPAAATAAATAAFGSQGSAFTRPSSNSNSNSGSAARSSRRTNEAGAQTPGNKGGGRSRVHKRRTRRYRKK